MGHGRSLLPNVAKQPCLVEPSRSKDYDTLNRIVCCLLGILGRARVSQECDGGYAVE